jgi:ABC-type molybdate transport system permease subunit
MIPIFLLLALNMIIIILILPLVLPPVLAGLYIHLETEEFVENMFEGLDEFILGE